MRRAATGADVLRVKLHKVVVSGRLMSNHTYRAGKSDPYAKLHYFKYQRQTKVKKKTLNPRWNEEFQLYVPTWSSPQVALIKVLDHDDFSRVRARCGNVEAGKVFKSEGSWHVGPAQDLG